MGKGFVENPFDQPAFTRGRSHGRPSKSRRGPPANFEEASPQTKSKTRNSAQNGNVVDSAPPFRKTLRKVGMKVGSSKTKILVRRIPPNISEEEFLQAIHPYRDSIDYICFVASPPASLGLAYVSLLGEAMSFLGRCYLHFKSADGACLFASEFDCHTFLNAQGQTQPVLVEYAPFERIPKYFSCIPKYLSDPKHTEPSPVLSPACSPNHPSPNSNIVGTHKIKSSTNSRPVHNSSELISSHCVITCRRKRDVKENTIFKDKKYLEFIATLEKPTEPLPSAEILYEKSMETLSHAEMQGKLPPKVKQVNTPLLEFIKSKRPTKSSSSLNSRSRPPTSSKKSGRGNSRPTQDPAASSVSEVSSSLNSAAPSNSRKKRSEKRNRSQKASSAASNPTERKRGPKDASLAHSASSQNPPSVEAQNVTPTIQLMKRAPLVGAHRSGGDPCSPQSAPVQPSPQILKSHKGRDRRLGDRFDVAKPPGNE
eukprot:Sdes_comp20148_c0_seq1m13266